MSDKEEKGAEACVCEPRTQEKESEPGKKGSRLKIGLVANYEGSDETRFLLTPEGCGILVSAGIDVLMERDAAVDINFSNEHYSEFGVTVTDRATALQSDVVLCFELMKEKDIKKMKKGATLLCMQADNIYNPKVAKALLEEKITLGCLERMYSHNEEMVFANIIDEIDGRTAIMYAEEALSFLGGGKGVLLGGIAGLTPCEVLLIGEGRKIYSAAMAAMAVGATVTLMDNDISSLQLARMLCGQNLVTSAMHPKVLCNRIKTADVIILDKCTHEFEIPQNLKKLVKESVYIIDFQEMQPSVCVPRTVAMALSNVLVNFFREMEMKNGFIGMMSTASGVQAGILTFDGKITNKLLGTVLHLPSTDISMLLASPAN